MSEDSFFVTVDESVFVSLAFFGDSLQEASSKNENHTRTRIMFLNTCIIELLTMNNYFLRNGKEK